MKPIKCTTVDETDDEADVAIGLENGMKSIDSNTSIFQMGVEQGRFTANVVENEKTVLQSTEFFTDTIGLMIHCGTHRRIALNVLDRHRSNDLWFPILTIQPEWSYEEAINRLIGLVLNVSNNKNEYKQSYHTPQMVNITRLQKPNCLEFVTRVLFYTELIIKSSDNGKPCGCSINGQWSKWYSYDEVKSISNLHGPEPLIWCKRLNIGKTINNDNDGVFSRSNEISIRRLTQMITSTNNQIDNATIINHDQLILLIYGEYVQHCFPSIYMNQHTFEEYLIHVRLNTPFEARRKDISHLFRAFNANGYQNYIDFVDFFTGLFAGDKATSHVGTNGLLRLGYIFRFYRSSKENVLNHEDLHTLAFDLLLLENSDDEPTPEEIDEQTRQIYQIFNIEPNGIVSRKVFNKISSTNERLRNGMSRLFRMDSPFEQIMTEPIYPSLNKRYSSHSLCGRCRDRHYTLATHSVTIQIDGIIIDPNIMINIVGTNGSNVRRQHSQEMFSADTLANQIIDQIREQFENQNESEWNTYEGRMKWIEPIKAICEQARTILMQEARVIKIQSPCYVFGDIHGNLNDLMVYERIFWRMGPACLTDNFLFLGDYVDRGEYSVECALYLLCCKVLEPNRFFLLRGNHEIRQVQQMFTFQAECIRKFKTQGLTIWQTLNSTFDALPIAALIDEQIFCAHGGIPTTMVKIKELNSNIPCPMVNPMVESPPAWQMLWNDPITKKEYDEQVASLRKTKQDHILSLNPVGHLPNTKRATGFYFNKDATENFLTSNNLTYVIRAHEVIQPGFVFHHDGRVLTVFSCSKYCGQNNDSAVILVGNNKIRPIKVETRANNV
ncbi:hypothetical protein RDWZM_006835 [Blomia tropicalis]|uniref:Serine/threonine-protein phosphatase n=1 Tax=Blomia tropicalis TaxID=40697 RepID=A0A9Q0M9A1_BLOTA|nr:hypothetical protein RDWZM_006835 [Blomia tropicalis]